MSTLSASAFLLFSLSFFFFYMFISFCCGCDPEDRAALLAFSHELNAPVWSADNVSALDCCRWAGVTCSAATSSTPSSRRVAMLELEDMNLSGQVSSSLGKLHRLRYISLSGNNLSGHIPEELFGLLQLEAIDLFGNSFYGPLSPSAGNLSNLNFLSLTGNHLSGSIPDVFHGLGKLVYLAARSNSFSGPLPHSLTSRSSLRFLDVTKNNLSGRIDHMNFSALSRLESLLLTNNRFTGFIPESISSCRNMKALFLDGNELRGQVPWGFKSLSFLQHLFLGYNRFSNITRALLAFQECRNLEVLHLSGNFQNEKIPGDEIVGFPRLKSALIDDSDLSGPFPMWLSRSGELVQLSLSGNYLIGEIPLFLTRLKNLNASKVQNDNVFTSLIGSQGVYLRLRPDFDLSMNLLSGNTWMLLSNLRQLVSLDLSHNAFSGFIPDAFVEMKSLQHLDLSWNQISGTIPSSLTQLTYLSYFCVSKNKLHGSVPTGSQFSTFPSQCFDGNQGLCYAGKQGCDSHPPSFIKPDEHDEEPHRVVDTGLPFAVGVSVGYAITFLFGGFFYYWRTKK